MLQRVAHRCHQLYCWSRSKQMQSRASYLKHISTAIDRCSVPVNLNDDACGEWDEALMEKEQRLD